MNILVFDTIFPVGHKDWNEHILRILSKEHTLYVLSIFHAASLVI